MDEIGVVINMVDLVVWNIIEESLLIEDLLLDIFDDEGQPPILDDRDDLFSALSDIIRPLIGDILIVEMDQLLVEEELLLAEDQHPPQVVVRGSIDSLRTLMDPQFKRQFRMSKETFEVLVTAVGNHLTATNRRQRLGTEVDTAVLMALWILANLDTFRAAGVVFGVSRSVIHYHYVIVIQALSEMADKYVKWPSLNERHRTKNECEQRTGYPGIIGAIDGTLIPITAPSVQRERYMDRHHSYSINVQAVCDRNGLFRHVYAGEPGSVHDARAFRRSGLYNVFLERGDLLDEDEHILADAAYMLTDKVMVPYRDNGNLTPRQRRFNFVHSSNRMIIERAFGMLKGKWRRLFHFHVLRFDYALNHILACFVLHNFILLGGRESDGMNVPPYGGDANAAVVAREHPLLAGARARGARKREAIALRLLPDN